MTGGSWPFPVVQGDYGSGDLHRRFSPHRRGINLRAILEEDQSRRRTTKRVDNLPFWVLRVARIVRCQLEIRWGCRGHIFMSYATPDRAIANEVFGWLRAAGHEPFIDHDLRDGISVGEDWKQRLYRVLRQVDAVIGVVTSSFVASNWCSAELGIADALGCRLMPLRAEPDVVHPLMRDLQYADYQVDPRQARDRVLQALRLLEATGGT